MIANGITKVLILANHKVFIKMISLENQEECLTSIKLKEDEQDVLLPCEAEQNSKAFRYGANISWYI